MFVFDDDGNDTTTTQQVKGTATTNDASLFAILLAQLSPEYQRMALAMRREFERDGIHLSYNEREEARELNNVIVGLESLLY